MIVLLSGEGPTDLGSCRNGQDICCDLDFKVGPMTMIVDQMLEVYLHYSHQTILGGYQYVGEPGLKSREKIRRGDNRKVSLVGKKREQETGYFYINSWMLGDIALEIEKNSGDKVIAVLFRDCDGTRSASPSLWNAKWSSMINGFGRAEFRRGVPMLPKPKSEVWLLSGASPHLHNCGTFEEISGNDNSPNSAKDQLAAALGGHKSGDELVDWLMNSPLDVNRAETMPSFKAFKAALDSAIQQVLH